MASEAYAKTKAWRKNHSRAAEARRWREKHPELAAEIKQRYLNKSRAERLPREAEAARQRRKADPAGQRVRYERWRTKRENTLAEIAGRPRSSECELCGEKGKIVFDHCHASGAFRGWLCDRCNKVLGLVHDSPSLLARMIDYLTRSTDGQADIKTA